MLILCKPHIKKRLKISIKPYVAKFYIIVESWITVILSTIKCIFFFFLYRHYTTIRMTPVCTCISSMCSSEGIYWISFSSYSMIDEYMVLRNEGVNIINHTYDFVNYRFVMKIDIFSCNVFVLPDNMCLSLATSCRDVSHVSCRDVSCVPYII